MEAQKLEQAAALNPFADMAEDATAQTTFKELTSTSGFKQRL